MDTNTAIDYLACLLPDNAVKLIDNITAEISVITRIELLAWPDATSDDTTLLNNFISDCVVWNLSEDIILKTIEVRKKYNLKIGDAIIAATTLVNREGYFLLSRNLSDFNKVPGLTVINPHTL